MAFQPPAPQGVVLTTEALLRFAPGRFLKDSPAAVNSLDFHRTEELLVVASEDDSLRLYDVQSGTLLKTLLARAAGARLVTFTHAPSCVLTAAGGRRGSGTEHEVRYHSFHDNTYLRFFKGHTGRITSLAMSPKTDAFLSASEDATLRLWDLRSPTCSGVLHASRTPTCAWDQQGLVFAAATDDGVVKVFDAKAYGAGPFAAFAFPLVGDGHATHLGFSLDGKQLVVAVGGSAVVLDAFEGRVLHVFDGRPGKHPPCEPAFTPDGKHLLMGGADGNIRLWRTGTGSTGAPSGAWEGHAAAPTALRWAPRRALAASGCTGGGVALWVPPPPAG